MAVPKVRIPTRHISPCTTVSQAVQLNWTAACLAETVHIDYCRGIHGMFRRDEKWHGARIFDGVYYDKLADSQAHHEALCCLPPKYVGMDAFNAVFSSTYEIDEKYGTHYHENFKKFLVYVQDNDLTVDGAMTDPKGDRSQAPHEQPDPDMYVHVVERRDDGIVVCGAKCHQTGSINSHWHIFMPTIAMGEADKDYAVSFACPTDAEGLYMIYGRQSCDTRKMEDGCIDVGNVKFGGQEALVVLDHVFIPNEYIFLNGEYEFAGMMVERFAGYHRQSYGGCKVGAFALTEPNAGSDASKGQTEAKQAAMARLFCSEHAMKTTTKAVQLFGGYGYTKDFPVERMMRDAKITEIYEGTSEVQRIVISANMGL